MSFPQPPNFLAMAIQAEEARRQREQDSLRQALMQQQRQQDIEHQGIEARKMGGKMKDIEARWGSEANEETRAGWRIYDAALKKKELEDEGAAQGTQAESSLATLLKNSQGNAAKIDPALLDSLKLQMLAGGESSPDTRLQQLAGIAQSNAAAQVQGATQKREDELALERGKAKIQQRKELRVDAEKRIRDVADTINSEARTRAITHYTNLMQDAMIAENGITQEEKNDLIVKIGSDPALRGAGVLANYNIIEMDAKAAARGAQDERAVARDIAEKTGMKFPRSTIQAVVAGKSVEDTFTGLPMRAKDQAERQRLASGAGALDALAHAASAAKRIAASDAGGMFSEMRLSPGARALGLGPDNTDLNEYDSFRNQVGELLTYALTGAQGAEQQINRIMSFMPKAAELARDSETEGLSPAAKKRIDTVLRLTTNLVAGASMADAAKTREIYERTFAERVKQYDSEGPTSAPVRDPRLPPIARPTGGQP